MTGDTKTVYETGITKSLEENKISQDTIAAFTAQLKDASGSGSPSNREKIPIRMLLKMKFATENRFGGIPEQEFIDHRFC